MTARTAVTTVVAAPFVVVAGVLVWLGWVAARLDGLWSEDGRRW